jgi:AraC-like DNA-binding protein
MKEGQSANLQSVRRAVSSVRMLINSDVSRHIVLSDLARYAGVNECTLKMGFRTLFKTSVYQYLLSRRMNYACNLIVSTKLPIKDIALQSGYESVSGFITSFRKYFGYTPGQLRKITEKESAVNRL